MKEALTISMAILSLAFAQFAVLAQPSMEILRPNSFDRWQPGLDFRIQWRSQGVTGGTDWNFILYTNNVQVGRLYLTAIDDGGGNWHADLTIPNEVHPYSIWDNMFVELPSSTNYTLRMHEDGSEVDDISDVFSLGMPVLRTRVSEMEVCWNARSNRMYQVQYRSTLTTNLWTNLGGSIQGNGSTNCITDAVILGQPQRFYRVEELP